ncbi:hypothetical protein PsorP6_016531 [Peronosclerospora sorghi]|uniref:Uncharacterized protein n=1 Tax=Peronosclerospora sorghi TaxID=230839 RepID=A0ACC0VKN2_9STRA|nr:hypothetical protein PsorP6_016531 [Peronosclerospora sorghi]
MVINVWWYLEQFLLTSPTPAMHDPVLISQSYQYTWLTLNDVFDPTPTLKVASNPDGQEHMMQLPLTTSSNYQERPMDISPDDTPTIAGDSQMMLPQTVMNSHDNSNTARQDHSIVPWFKDATVTGDGVQDDDDSGEPYPKRLRLTEGYEIALKVMEIPLTYKKAMALLQDDKWKETIRRELPSHFQNHTWDAIRRPDGV